MISSQIDLHTLYGGVVPEIASRKHIEKINQVIEEALRQAEVTLDGIDAIGVTYGPGLVGALLVGWRRQRPSPMPGDFPWWAYITLKAMCRQIILNIRSWNRLSSARLSPEAIPIW